MTYENALRNPWAERYKKLLALDDHALAELLTTRGKPVLGLSQFSPETASERLRNGLDEVHIATDQGVDIARRLLSRSHAYALVRYPSLESFAAGIYEENLDFEPLLATAVIGGAGVGKSALMKAIRRLWSEAESVTLPDGTRVPLIAFARLRIGDKSSERDQRAELLRQYGASVSEQQQRRVTPSLVRRRGYIAGCCHLVADEMQFTSLGGESAAVTKLLLAFTHLGPPTTFVANFSLIHRLLKRKQEDQERLLSDVILMQPETTDSQKLIERIQQYVLVADGKLDINLQSAAERLDFMSGGSGRAMRELVVMGARMKWTDSRKGTREVVTIADLEAAYRSQQFAMLRENSRLLLQQRLSRSPVDPKRLDLWCPMLPVSSDLNDTQRKLQEAAEKARLRELGSAALRSQMPYRATQQLENSGGAASSVTAPKLSEGKKRSAGVTLEGLLARAATNRSRS